MMTSSPEQTRIENCLVASKEQLLFTQWSLLVLVFSLYTRCRLREQQVLPRMLRRCAWLAGEHQASTLLQSLRLRPHTFLRSQCATQLSRPRVVQISFVRASVLDLLFFSTRIFLLVDHLTMLGRLKPCFIGSPFQTPALKRNVKATQSQLRCPWNSFASPLFLQFHRDCQKGKWGKMDLM